MFFIKKEKNNKKIQDTNDFSEFFLNASAREKKKLFIEVARLANEDQRKLIERYETLGNRV